MRQALARFSVLKFCVIGLSVAPALSQVRAELPASVVESGSIGEGDQAQIEQFVARIAGAALGDDAEAAEAAWGAMIAPLATRQPSVAFRQAYAGAAAELIASLLGHESPGAKLAGLRLAGSLATGETLEVIIPALTHEDEGVRAFAAVQARRVFEVTSEAGMALTEGQVSGLVDALSSAAAEQDEPLLVQPIVRALGAGAQLRERELTETRSMALAALSAVVAARVREMNAAADPGRAMDTVLLGADAATRSVSEVGAVVTDAAAKAAAELGGEILAVVLDRQNRGLIGDDTVSDVRLLRAGEALIYFARRRQIENTGRGADSVPQTNLAGLLESGDRSFRNELVRLIGPSSEFLRQFGLPDDRFVK